MRWSVHAGGHMAGPYEEPELRALVEKGLRDALVRAEGGDWIHLSNSPFAQFIKPEPSGPSLLLRIASSLSILFLIWLGWHAFWLLLVQR